MYTNFGLELLTINPSLYEQADKASMLDEIIDYVKFLQLQVKVHLQSGLFGVWDEVGALAPFLMADSLLEFCRY
jgi:hypothetical protein